MLATYRALHCMLYIRESMTSSPQPYEVVSTPVK